MQNKIFHYQDNKHIFKLFIYFLRFILAYTQFSYSRHPAKVFLLPVSPHLLFVGCGTRHPARSHIIFSDDAFSHLIAYPLSPPTALY